MPFNFSERKHYSIDYESLFNDINSKKILTNKRVQTEYVKAWINFLIKADQVVTEQLKTDQQILELNKHLLLEPEIFQLPMYHENNTIVIHFRASIANQIISEFKMKKDAQLINIDEFVKKDRRILWTHVNENVDSYANNQDPIIMVPFINGQYSNLVIDGNHRLTYKVKENIKSVPTLILAESSVIDYSIFSSTFDKYYYIMNNEFSYMNNESYNKNVDSYELMKKSYLADGKFKFKD
ncbi:hypothetical protein [Clostridium botulinum]|uniref:hypothetical protein n=1 Tax=Clostridium botulinum TaxID=1491 RepID=UPI000774477F|nr:hypothetical protein [Clostridium botulinum]MBY6931016.1 hypothetical protein [Clostridium botulinum]NFG19922.1 hypothetical protein [Clostridium botulinum]NFO82224.1 hypothetical protein [Clostridium botulinum]